MIYFLLVPLKEKRYLLSYMSTGKANLSGPQQALENSTKSIIVVKNKLGELDDQQSPYFGSCAEESQYWEEIEEIIKSKDGYQLPSARVDSVEIEEEKLLEWMKKNNDKSIQGEEISWDKLRTIRSVDGSKKTADKKEESEDENEGSSSSAPAPDKIEVDLQNLQTFYELIRPRRNLRQNVYLMSKLPENLQDYKDSYIFIQGKENKPSILYYIDKNGKKKWLPLDAEKFAELIAAKALKNHEDSQLLQVTLQKAENVQLFESFWDLITSNKGHTHLDSTVIAAMKVHPKIGVHTNKYDFKASNVDSLRKLAERLKLPDDKDNKKVFNKKLSARAYEYEEQEEEFVVCDSIIYYPSEEIPQFSHPLSRLRQSAYRIYITAVPREAVRADAGEVSIIDQKEFLKTCIDHVSKQQEQEVIYLVHGNFDQEKQQCQYSNAELYNELEWEKVITPVEGESGAHIFKLPRSKTEAQADIQITFLNTINNSPTQHRVSIDLTEKDLWHLHSLATKIRAGQPIIIHCTAGYDRASRSLLAIDLFLEFNQIMQNNQDQSVDAIIERYLNLRRTRAPGALTNIKQCEEAFYLAYAFKAIDICQNALQQLQQYTDEADFFKKLKACQSTGEKVRYVEQWLDEHQFENEIKKQQFILFERVLRECRLAERACLWEVNPQHYLQFPEFVPAAERERHAIKTVKQLYLEMILLEDYAVLLKRYPGVEVPMRPALLATSIVWEDNEEILRIKKIAETPSEVEGRNAEENTEETSKDSGEKTAEQKQKEDKGKGKTIDEDGVEEEESDASSAGSKVPGYTVRSEKISVKFQLSEPTGSCLTEENKNRLLEVVEQYREKAKKIPAVETVNDHINNMKTEFESHLKSSTLNHLRLENNLVHYIYNRIHRRQTKTRAILIGTRFFSPELFHIKNKDEQKAKYKEIVNYALWVYSKKNRAVKFESCRQSGCALLKTSSHPLEIFDDLPITDEAYLIYNHEVFYVSKMQGKCINQNLDVDKFSNFCSILEIRNLEDDKPRILSHSELEKITPIMEDATFLKNELNKLKKHDPLTFKKIMDAFDLIGELYYQHNQSLDNAMSEILTENPDGPSEIESTSSKERIAKDLEEKVRNSMLSTIKQHRQKNRSFEAEKWCNRLFPCINRSDYDYILKLEKESLEESKTSVNPTTT